MTRECIMGCTIRDSHFAECDDYGLRNAECRGCVPRDARDGGYLCSRCYGRLWRAIESTPATVTHLREMTHAGPSAKRYDREIITGGRAIMSAPVSVDLLDAQRDILATFSTSPEQITEKVADVLGRFDAIVNDADAVLEWWAMLMPHEIPDAPGFWTVNRAAARWPMEDRRKRSTMACPDCHDFTVSQIPPTTPGAPAWFTCDCGWSARDTEVDANARTIDVDAPEIPIESAAAQLGISAARTAEWVASGELITRAEADAIAGSTKTLRRWVVAQRLAPVGEILIGSRRVQLFRRSELEHARTIAAENKRKGQMKGQFRKAPHD